MMGYEGGHAMSWISAIDRDPEFARWLHQDYVPIAGGWQY
jgi:hypothetical protein